MHIKFLVIPAVLLCQATIAQTGTSSLTLTQATPTTPAAAPATTPPGDSNATPSAPAPVPAVGSISSEEAAAEGRVSYLDYKSVYEASTVEEEVKMAAERFALTPSQQEVWLTAATDRRVAEKVAREKLDSKTANYERDGVYRGLRNSHNTFHEIITGYLTPNQKQAMELDRQILQEKQQRMAKLPPPPPPAPTVTVAPVDSSAIKETEKSKTGKKSKKKKKAVMQ
jgi:hypothetical protein